MQEVGRASYLSTAPIPRRRWVTHLIQDAPAAPHLHSTGGVRWPGCTAHGERQFAEGILSKHSPHPQEEVGSSSYLRCPCCSPPAEHLRSKMANLRSTCGDGVCGVRSTCGDGVCGVRSMTLRSPQICGAESAEMLRARSSCGADSPSAEHILDYAELPAAERKPPAAGCAEKTHLGAVQLGAVHPQVLPSQPSCKA